MNRNALNKLVAAIVTVAVEQAKEDKIMFNPVAPDEIANDPELSEIYFQAYGEAKKR